MAGHKRNPCIRKIIRVLILTGGMLAIVVGARLWYLEEQGNFHPITPHEAYRSAQLDQDELQFYIRKFRIRSVINLRGSNPEARWYKEEISTSRKLGVYHYNLGLSADQRPAADQIQALLKLYEIAPRPVLIHCQGGADRSGLAAAIWLEAIKGRPKSEAKKQLSILYGHVSFGPTLVLDRFFDHWAPERCKAFQEKPFSPLSMSEVEFKTSGSVAMLSQ